jgi:hypothetical protein
MRYTLVIYALAILIAGGLCLVGNSSHGLGTGANYWDFRSFGWPVEIWSRTKHTYQTLTISPGERKVERVDYPTQYSVKWVNAGMVFGGALGVSFLLSMCIPRPKDR